MLNTTISSTTEIEVPNLLIIEKFLDTDTMSVVFRTLLETVEWDNSMTARKTASFGIPYNYSQMNYPMVPMHPVLVPIREKLLEHLGVGL